jgi:hypothetical protein
MEKTMIAMARPITRVRRRNAGIFNQQWSIAALVSVLVGSYRMFMRPNVLQFTGANRAR